MKEFVLLFSAEADIQQAFEHYNDQMEGLGEEFLKYLELSFSQIKHFPESAPLFASSHRKKIIEKYPYGIFYTIYPTRIVVSGIMDLRQDTLKIRERLKE